MKLLLRWLVIAISLVVAVLLIPGIYVDGNGWIVIAVMAVILGLVNAIIRPILNFLSCGCIVATLGLFALVVNAFTFWLASWIAQQLGIGFQVDNFLAAFLGSLVVSVVSFILNMVLIDD